MLWYLLCFVWMVYLLPVKHPLISCIQFNKFPVLWYLKNYRFRPDIKLLALVITQYMYILEDNGAYRCKSIIQKASIFNYISILYSILFIYLLRFCKNILCFTGKGKQAGKHPCTDNALLWVPVTLLLLMTLFYATMTVFFLYYRYKIMNNL
jgi:hypothetical protein